MNSGLDMEKRYDIFISYSSCDQKIAEGICGYLERMGYRCFVAYRDIPRGVVWAAAITDAIDDSAMMVVVFSNAFNISPQTDREIELASENKMPILTYRIANDEMTGAKKYYLKNLNWIDAFPNPENYFGQLLDSVVKLIGKKQGGGNSTNRKQVVPKQEPKTSQSTNRSGKPTSSFNGHEYVDLGLPSGTLWATCNVGASKPEDYGDYLTWDKGKTAVANWGRGWRMPSREQWEELKENTKSSWTTRNGMNGNLFTSEKNGQTLFLPAAGYRYDSRDFNDVGSIGHYWSSSPKLDSTYYAWFCYFGSYFTNVSLKGRHHGQSVRPVRSARRN